MNKAVFLDRDGVINKAKVVDGKPYPPKNRSEVEIFEYVGKCVTLLNETGYEIVVVTNQPDIARGKTDLSQVDDINSFIEMNTGISNYYVCAHDEVDDCECRKPKIGLFLQAADELNLDLKNSFMVGDRWKDIEAGQNAGCMCFFINNKYIEKLPVQPFIEVDSLMAATILITNVGEKLYD